MQFPVVSKIVSVGIFVTLPCQPFQFVMIAAVVVVSFDNQMPVPVYHLYIVKVLKKVRFRIMLVCKKL